MNEGEKSQPDKGTTDHTKQSVQEKKREALEQIVEKSRQRRMDKTGASHSADFLYDEHGLPK